MAKLNAHNLKLVDSMDNIEKMKNDLCVGKYKGIYYLRYLVLVNHKH